MCEQHTSLPPALLAELNLFLADNIGLYFARERLADLERGLRGVAREMGDADLETCVRALLQSPLTRRQIEVLAHHLTVGETYFFREKESLNALEDHILRPLVQARGQLERRLRIWSAGCATGEEPYSIAIALARTIPDIARWDISILATDINPRALNKASAGVYSDWSFRNALPDFKNAYFKPTAGGRWQIAAGIKSLVKFEYLNLAQDCYPSAGNGTSEMDIVFCRNVLMYFEPAHARKVLLNLSRSLLEGGWMFLNPVEIPHLALPQLVPVNFAGVTLHRKDSRAANVAQPLPTLTPAPADLQVTAPPVDLPVITAPQPALEVRSSGAPVPAPESVSLPAPTPHEQAVAHYDQGRYDDAARELLEILHVAPEDAAATGLLARTYANAGNLPAALQWCEKTIEADKLHAGWRYLLATILLEQGLADAAAAALRRALYLDDNHALAHYALGNLIRRQGRPEDAALHYRNALTILSGYPQQQVLPESEGITAGSLAAMIRSSAAGT